MPELRRSLPNLSEKTLHKNLAALTQIHPVLARRICLPVDGSHVTFDQLGRARYRHLRNWKSLGVEPGHIDRCIKQAERAEGIFLFGIGLGEPIGPLLEARPDLTITAWDRDPWLMRLCLSAHDYSDALLAGQLRLAMCADLVREKERYDNSLVIDHPLLAEVYRHERRLLEEGVRERRAVVIAGELFVDDLIEALHGQHTSVYQIDPKILSVEEMAVVTETFRPEFIAAINYKNGLAELCHARKIGLLCWEIDPTRDRLQCCQAPTDRVFIFTYRRAQVAEFRRAGFKNVEYLPLAANTLRRFPATPAQAEDEKYHAEVCFVGASMAGQARSNRKDFLDLYRESGLEEDERGGDCLVEDLLAVQRRDYSRYMIPDLLESMAPGLVQSIEKKNRTLDPAKLIAEIAASAKRQEYLDRLGEFGIRVWGDGYWKHLEESGARYMGPAEHFHELNRVYSGALINVDIGRLYQSDMITMRVFDVMACGGFILAEYSDALAELFQIGHHLDAYKTLDELVDKVRWYGARPGLVRSIAERGREAVLSGHTIRGRVRYMLESMAVGV